MGSFGAHRPVRRVVRKAGAAGLLASAMVAVGLHVPATAATPTCFGKPATIVGTSGSNKITGTSRDDVIVGGGGNDTIVGGAGNDLICGGDGADLLRGGSGDDMIEGGPGQVVDGRIKNDTMTGDTGNDFFSPGYDSRGPSNVPDRIIYNYSATPVTVNAGTHTVTGEGTDTWIGNRVEFYGSKYADTFIGGPYADTFNGYAGSDTMSGGGGDDTLRDDSPSSADGEKDTLNGGPGNDQLFTQGGPDTLIGDSGNDKLWDYGRSAGTMDSGDGNDDIRDGIAVGNGQRLDAGPGTDTVSLYTSMRLTSLPRLTVDTLAGSGVFAGYSSFGFSGVESLDVHGVPLSWSGTNGNDSVTTDGTGNLVASGRGGNDTMTGGPSNDRFDGGPGSDTVRKNGGSDTCVAVETFLDGSCAAG